MVLADRGYLNGEQVFACKGTGVLPCVPKPLTSRHAKRGFFTGLDFVYDAEKNDYTSSPGSICPRCPPDATARPRQMRWITIAI